MAEYFSVAMVFCSPQEVCTEEETHHLGAVVVLYYVCGLVVAGAHAEAAECRLVELQCEMALTFGLRQQALCRYLLGEVLRQAPNCMRLRDRVRKCT